MRNVCMCMQYQLLKLLILVSKLNDSF